MKTKWKADQKPLTELEQYQFSLCQSGAVTPRCQREAIYREGLQGLTRREIRARQLANWKQTKRKNPRVPLWVLAAQQEGRPWDYQAPAGTPTGIVVRCNALMNHAYDHAPWGRLRKCRYGEANVFPARIRTESTGSGWNKVSRHYADYGCVIHPDGTKLAYQVFGSDRWIVARVRRDSLSGVQRFFGPGHRLMSLDSRSKNFDDPPRPQFLRRLKNILCRAGYVAKLGYQSSSDVLRGDPIFDWSTPADNKSLVLVVDLGELGTYHVGNSYGERLIVCHLRAIERERRRQTLDARRQQLLNELLASGPRFFVGFNDSIEGGNCVPGTTAGADQIRRHLGLTADQAGGIRADVLLGIRDDHYTRHAIYAAALRLKLI